MSNEKSTPRPWSVDTRMLNDKEITIYCSAGYDKCGKTIAKVDNDDNAEGVPNAWLIVRAVNNHDALVEALKAAQGRLNSLNAYFKAPNFTDRYGDAERNDEVLETILTALKNAEQ